MPTGYFFRKNRCKRLLHCKFAAGYVFQVLMKVRIGFGKERKVLDGVEDLTFSELLVAVRKLYSVAE